MAGFDYDLIIIGGGAAAFVASKVAAGLGKKVAMIEKNRLGGECTLYGCVPSKTLIRSSAVMFHARNLGRYGLYAKAEQDIGTDNVMEHVRSVVRTVTAGHPAESFEKQGITVIFDAVHFINNHHIALSSGKKLSAKSFILATGSSSLIPSVEGINTVPYLTNETIFEIGKLPGSMIALGGGPISIELASALNRLGVAMTVVQSGPRILPKDDHELTDMLTRKLQAEGVRIHTNSKAVKLSQEGNRIIAVVKDEQKQSSQQLEAESVLVAVGRKANVDGLNLENAGVEYTSKAVKTDEKLRTTAPNIYACGDVAGPYQFSHMAEYQAVIAAQNALLPIKRKADYCNAAWCTFTDPELAHAGLAEEEARKSYGDAIKVYRYEYSHIDRGRTDIAEFGMSKFICDANYRLLGAHILGSRAGDIIHEVQLARLLNLPFYKLASVIHIYPGFSDIIKQPAKLCYIDKLQSNPFLKLLKRLLA
jgi:pyruvate/2-oxoglutarate dehydrogenase complex dihydrolipoamide dehydrogenase (E3) component